LIAAANHRFNERESSWSFEQAGACAGTSGRCQPSCSRMSAILAPIALTFRRFLFSAGLWKNPHRDNHEGCRREDKISEFRPHR